jgi:hypothetical protein
MNTENSNFSIEPDYSQNILNSTAVLRYFVIDWKDVKWFSGSYDDCKQYIEKQESLILTPNRQNMETKKQLAENIENIFRDVERIHGKSEAIDWIKLAAYKSASFIIETNLPLPEPTEITDEDINVAGEMYDDENITIKAFIAGAKAFHDGKITHTK